MDEMVKVLNEQGQEMGSIVEKLKAHKEGICHGVVVIAIINSNGKVIIQKRAIAKREEPGKWDLSASGHISSDEAIIDAAIRETYEEIGIKIVADDLTYIDTFLFKAEGFNKKISHYTYVFIVKKDIDESELVLQESEVDEVKFVDKKELLEMLNKGKMVSPFKYCAKILDYMK